MKCIELADLYMLSVSIAYHDEQIATRLYVIMATLYRLAR